jgi:uncharacterized protein
MKIDTDGIMREGDWSQTYCGIAFWPHDPRPEDVDIRDIAHALSLMCRFGGHSRCFYSVAEHSIRVAALCSQKNKLAALLHDAAEAYLVDLPRPIKYSGAMGFEYRKMEVGINIIIHQKFNIVPSVSAKKEIDLADDILLATEARDLLGPHPIPWAALPEPLKETIQPWGTPGQAEFCFLDAFRRLATK